MIEIKKFENVYGIKKLNNPYGHPYQHKLN